jgi:hypothetical protein
MKLTEIRVKARKNPGAMGLFLWMDLNSVKQRDFGKNADNNR